MRGEKPKTKKLWGCLGRLVILALLGALMLLLGADYVYNLKSNAVYMAFRHSSKPLEVKLGDGSWKAVSAVSAPELTRALETQAEAPGMVWKTLPVRREAVTKEQRLAQSIFGSQVAIIEIEPSHFQFATSFQERFVLTTARERLKSEEAAFAITANFRDPSGKPLGLVIHEGKQRNGTFPAWTGYFFVKDNKPWFGPKSLYEREKEKDKATQFIQEASQGYPSLMTNHTVFSYVDLAPRAYFNGEKITYRALGGMRQDGKIVFILSGDGGAMNVSEVAALALKLNLQHATLLDGGRALQYSLHIGGVTHHFHAFNTVLNLDDKELGWERSPVFITVKAAKPLPLLSRTP